LSAAILPVAREHGNDERNRATTLLPAVDPLESRTNPRLPVTGRGRSLSISPHVDGPSSDSGRFSPLRIRGQGAPLELDASYKPLTISTAELDAVTTPEAATA
jgi:hypothetical protein